MNICVYATIEERGLGLEFHLAWNSRLDKSEDKFMELLLSYPLYVGRVTVIALGLIANPEHL